MSQTFRPPPDIRAIDLLIPASIELVIYRKLSLVNLLKLLDIRPLSALAVIFICTEQAEELVGVLAS